jgi:hypothetical protein
MRETVTDAKQRLTTASLRPGFPLRNLRTLQDGVENRGQLFALTRVLPNARPFGLPVYVAPLPAGSIPVAAARAFPR